MPPRRWGNHRGVKLRRRVVLLDDVQLAGLRAAAAVAADQVTRQAAEHPDRRDRLRRDATAYRRVAELLADAVQGEIAIWGPDD